MTGQERVWRMENRKKKKMSVAPETVFLVLKMMLSVVVFVLALLQLVGVFDRAIYIFEPLLGALMILQGLQAWKRNKLIAAFSFVAALVVLGIAGFIAW